MPSFDVLTAPQFISIDEPQQLLDIALDYFIARARCADSSAPG